VKNCKQRQPFIANESLCQCFYFQWDTGTAAN
jgi:hypothetical protein